GAHFARGGINARVAVHAMLDALIATEAAIRFAERPADLGELPAARLRHAAFEPQQPRDAQIGRILAHRFGRSLMVPTRRVARRLDLEPVIDAIDDDLRLPLRLHVAAHYAEAHPRHLPARRKARDDRLERPLA